MISPNKIYEYRNMVRELYKEESSATNDLVFNILSHKDVYSNIVNIINVSLETNSISVEFTDKANSSDISTITTSILLDIKKFIMFNIDTSVMTQEFAEFLDKALYVDYITTNLSVEFNL